MAKFAEHYSQKSNSKNDNNGYASNTAPAQIFFNNARHKTRPNDPSRADKLTKTLLESFSFFIETDYKTFSTGLKTLTLKQDYLKEIIFKLTFEIEKKNIHLKI